MLDICSGTALLGHRVCVYSTLVDLPANLPRWLWQFTLPIGARRIPVVAPFMDNGHHCLISAISAHGGIVLWWLFFSLMKTAVEFLSHGLMWLLGECEGTVHIRLLAQGLACGKRSVKPRALIVPSPIWWQWSTWHDLHMAHFYLLIIIFIFVFFSFLGCYRIKHWQLDKS